MNKDIGIYAKTPAEYALRQLQFALRDIHDELNLGTLDVRFKNASLSLSTQTEVSAGGKVQVFVVTVAGAIGVSSTSTLDITLGPPEGVDGVLDAIIPAESLKALTRHMLLIIEQARVGAYALAFEEGSVTAEIVVNAKGEIELAAPAAIKVILEAFGIGVSANLSAGIVKTSSITINFEKKS